MNGVLDMPVTIEGDAGIPFHIVHSDPDHLAYLAGLIVLQAWTSGIDELGIPPAERRPILVVTDKPGRFGDAYLQLHLPVEKIEVAICATKGHAFEKTGRAPEQRQRKQDIGNRISNPVTKEPDFTTSSPPTRFSVVEGIQKFLPVDSILVVATKLAQLC